LDTLRDRYQQVLERIHTAETAAGRPGEAVRLVVVTKGHPLETVRLAVEAGARRLGENYPEEGVEKVTGLEGVPGLEWHMIGHVQSRKAKPVAEHFDWVHSLDSARLALRLDRFAGEAGRTLPVLLECNVSGEESKFGLPAFAEAGWPVLAGEIEPILALPNLQVRGLMTMAPLFDDPEQTRPCFQRLRRLQEYLARRFPRASWAELSMGMSSDFEVAIQEGATLVRVGQAILGPRPVPVQEKIT
jgi:pyridoxal phosphate enzyme (YggS family)